MTHFLILEGRNTLELKKRLQQFNLAVMLNRVHTTPLLGTPRASTSPMPGMDLRTQNLISTPQSGRSDLEKAISVDTALSLPQQ